MRLAELLERVQFDHEVRASSFRFGTDLFKVYRAKRSEDSLPGIAFSEYFFVSISEAVISKMSEGSGLQYFREFQSKLLSKEFFSYKSDIRWNIYLILVIDGYEIVKDSSLLHAIENDSDYARKFVATPGDVIKWMDKEWLHVPSNENSEQADPLLDWAKQLEAEQLVGCLNGKFSKESVRSYLEGNVFPDNEIASKGQTGKKAKGYDEIIESVKSISFDGFRSHCFDRATPMLPTAVNLLHGSNGSGKTSAVEAIEFALTNEIRRCKEFRDPIEQSAANLTVRCNTEKQSSLLFKSGQPTAFYKNLAQTWYGISSGRDSELNYFFHRYNYFDSEAAYRFALSESGSGDNDKFDYSGNLSRLVYGDRVLDTQDRWTRYLKEFQDQLSELNKHKVKVSVRTVELEKQIAAFDENEEGSMINPEALINTLHLQDITKQRGNEETLTDYWDRISFVLRSIEPQLIEITDYPQSESILSYAFITRELGQYQSQLKILFEDRASKTAERDKLLSEQQNTNKAYQETEHQYLHLSQQLANLKNDLDDWKNVRLILEHPARIELKQNLDKETWILQEKATHIKVMLAKYEGVELFSNEVLNVLSEEDLKAQRNALTDKQKELLDAKTKLAEAEEMMDKLNITLSRLQHYGEEFLKLDTNETKCPLCKHDYSSHYELSASILLVANGLQDNGESQTHGLREQIETITEYIVGIELVLAVNDANSRNRTLVRTAFDHLATLFSTELYGTQDSPEDKLQAIKRIVAVYPDLEAQIRALNNQIKVYEDQGFTREAIIGAELFKKENQSYNVFLNENVAVTYEHYIMTMMQNLQNEITKATQEKEQVKKLQADLIKRIGLIQLSDTEKSIEKQRQKIEALQRLVDNVETLRNEFDLGHIDNLRTWSIQVKQAQSRLELLSAKLRNEEQVTRLQGELETINQEFDKVTAKIKRCTAACETLQLLKPLKIYTEQFIRSNISQIEKFFKLLHTPREFDAVTLEDEGLMLNRKWDGKSVKAYQMSSGQRASLALSVMFAVHLAAPSAPRFIIMDEPVANMDDLHLMNLLDLLRDLALSGRQIFFTTANPDVANLFRRKFSFFHERFTRFEFTRHSGEPVHIEAITYRHDQESPVSKII